MSLWGSKRVRGKTAEGGKSFASMSADDPDVAALWKFDAASGTTMTDVVNSVDLIVTGTSVVPTYYNHLVDNYQVTNGGTYQNIAPGFGLQQNGLITATGQDGVLGNGTGSFTYEIYYHSLNLGATTQIMNVNSSATGGINFYLHRNGYIYFRVIATDGTSVICQTSTDTSKYNVCNGQLRHLRFVYDAENNLMKIFLDGSQEQSVDASSLSGKTIEVDQLGVCRTSATNFDFTVLYEVRISHNATNNGYRYA